MGMPFYLDLILLIFVLTPVVAAIALVRSRRRASREGAPSTMWASAGLVVIRGAALLAVIGLLFVVVAPGDSSSQVISDGQIELESGWYDEEADALQDGRRLTIAVLSEYMPLELCPSRSEAMESRPGVSQAVEARCWARRNLDANYDGVDVGEWTMVKHVEDPPASVTWTLALLELVALLGVGLVLLSLDRILVRTARRQPFASDNVRWLRLLAVGVGVAGIVHPALERRYTNELVLEYLGQAGKQAIAFDEWWAVGYTPWIAVLLVLILAEVWRFGIRLQEDVEATV